MFGHFIPCFLMEQNLLKKWFSWLQQCNLDDCPRVLMGICWVHYRDWAFKFICLNYILRKSPRCLEWNKSDFYFFLFLWSLGQILTDLKKIDSLRGGKLSGKSRYSSDVFSASFWELRGQRCISSASRKCILFIPPSKCHPALRGAGFSSSTALQQQHLPSQGAHVDCVLSQLESCKAGEYLCLGIYPVFN